MANGNAYRRLLKIILFDTREETIKIALKALNIETKNKEKAPNHATADRILNLRSAHRK